MKTHPHFRQIYIFAIICTLFSFKANAQEPDHEGSRVNWMTLEEALEKVKTTPKPIILDFYTDWCGWCKQMMKTTYADPNFAAYINTYFYPAKFNAEGKDTIEYLGVKYIPNSKEPRATHPLAMKLLQGKLTYPTTLFLNGYEKDKKEFGMNMLATGYLEVQKMEPILIFTLENVYRNSNYDDFRVQYEKAFFDTTVDKQNKEKVKWNAPKDVFNSTYQAKGKFKLVYINNNDWCNACKVMKRTSFIDTTLNAYLGEKYDLVDFNPENSDTLMFKGKAYTNPKTQAMPFHQLAFEFGKGNLVFPTLIFLDENNEFLDAIPSYLPPAVMSKIMRYYGDGINKTKSWKEFYTGTK